MKFSLISAFGISHLILVHWFTKSSVVKSIDTSKKLLLALLVLIFNIILSFYRHLILDRCFNALFFNRIRRQEIFWSHVIIHFPVGVFFIGIVEFWPYVVSLLNFRSFLSHIHNARLWISSFKTWIIIWLALTFLSFQI